MVRSKAPRRIGYTALDGGDVDDETTRRTEDCYPQTWRSPDAEGPLLIALEVLDLYRLAQIGVTGVKGGRAGIRGPVSHRMKDDKYAVRAFECHLVTSRGARECRVRLGSHRVGRNATAELNHESVVPIMLADSDGGHGRAADGATTKRAAHKAARRRGGGSGGGRSARCGAGTR